MPLTMPTIHQECLGHLLSAENRAHLCPNPSSLQDPTAFGNLDSLFGLEKLVWAEKFSSVGKSQLPQLSPAVDDWDSGGQGRVKSQGRSFGGKAVWWSSQSAGRESPVTREQ